MLKAMQPEQKVGGSFDCCQLSAISGFGLCSESLTKDQKNNIDNKVRNSNLAAVLLENTQAAAIKYLKEQHHFRIVAKFPSGHDSQLLCVLFRPRDEFKLKYGKVRLPNVWVK